MLLNEFSILQIAFRAAPYKDQFIAVLAEDASVDPTDAYYRKTLFADGERYQKAVRIVCSPLIQLYKKHNMVIVEES